MLKYIFVIALVLPVCCCLSVFAEENKSESWDLQSQCFNETNEKLNSSYINYTHMLTSYVQKKNSESLAKLNASLTNFTKVVTETCAGGKMPSNVNTSFFIDLIEFAVKDDKYSNFINSNGSSCVYAVEPDINKCIQDHLGTTTRPKAGNDTNINATKAHDGVHDNNTNDDVANITQIYIKNILGLLKKTNLEFNEYTCDKTTEIRTCVVFAMKKDNTTCTIEQAEYVDSLFGFAYNMKKCPPPSHRSRSGANSLLLNAVAILPALIGAMLIN